MVRSVPQSAIGNRQSAIGLRLFRVLRSAFRVLALLGFLAAGAAFAAEPPIRLEVLRAETYGSVVDVLLRVEVPGVEAGELGPGDFAVFVAPADLAPAEATTPRFRVARLFLKRLGSAYYVDLRQLPAAVGSTACQLVLQVNHRGQLLATERLPKLLEHKAGELDVALVIDESLSMTRTDPGNLRLVAAKTFVDLARRSTRISRIAIVSFNDHARTRIGLTSPANADPLYQAIDRIIAFDQTDIDAALGQARAAFDASPGGGDKAVVLLTDGKNEPDPYRDTHRLFAERHWRIYTIGLSEAADAEVLQRIASDTGGEYHGAPTNAELQDIFSKICLTLQKKVLIRSRDLAVKPGQATEDPCPVDDTISALTLSLNARDADTAFLLRDPKGRMLASGRSGVPRPSSDLGVRREEGTLKQELERGTPFGPDLAKTERGVFYGRGATFQFFEITGPLVGDWTARIESPRAEQINLAATAATPLLLRAYPLKPSYYRGEPIEIAASLAIGDSVLADARIEARVLTADGVAPSLPRVSDPREGIAVRLYDDGAHQDTARDDGVFAGLFPGSEAPGPCVVHLLATGTTPAGNRFERELRLSTAIAAEGYSKLWCSARSLDFGILYNGERATRPFDLKLSAVLPGSADTIQAIIKAPSASSERKLAAAAVTLDPSPIRLDSGKLAAAKLAVSIPPDQPAGEYRGELTLASRYDKLTLGIQFEVRPPKLVFDKPTLDLGAVESGSRVEAPVALRLDPRGALAVRLAPSDPRLTAAPADLQAGTEPSSARVVLAAPPDAPSAAFQAKLVVETPVGKTELPVTARIVQPSVSVFPPTLDFGEVRPGEAVERPLALRLDGLVARDAALTASPLASQGLPSLPLALSEAGLALAPGAVTPAKLTLRVPPAQPPGTYASQVTVQTPLGKKTIDCVARVAEAPTFRLAGTLDFEQVATGSTKELAVDVTSLVDAEQKIALTVTYPPAGFKPAGGYPDWQLAAEPTALVLPPQGKATVVFRLTAPPTAKPGAREAAIAFRGPSRAATIEVRAELFRSPHRSLAFEPPTLDVGNLRSGVSESRQVLVRSLIDEEQKVAIERVDSPVAVLALEPDPNSWTLPPSGSAGVPRPSSDLGVRQGEGTLEQELERGTPPGRRPASGAQAVTLTLRPAQGIEEAEFEVAVVARGRSLPETLRLRGRVFTPPGATVALEPDVLDFGPMVPGARKGLAARVWSLRAAPQRILLGEAPTAEGVSLALGCEDTLKQELERGTPANRRIDGVPRPSSYLGVPTEVPGFSLGAFTGRDVPIQVVVSSDAPLGEQRMAWEVRGPGLSATLEVRVEVVAPPAEAPPLVARTESTPGIGWAEGAALFVLLLLLLLILLAVFLIGRWLIRTQRLPRMTKYFALSALIHAGVFLIAVDLLVAREVQKQKVGPLFRVGLRAISGGSAWSDRASVADAPHARQERERQTEAARRQRQADLTRLQAEAQRAQLTPAQADLLRPKPAERPELAKAEPQAKKLSVDDLAKVLEEVRERERVQEAQKPDRQDPAQVDPARVGQIRSMTREQLEAAIQEASRPKPTQLAKPSSTPVPPDLDRPQATERARPSLDEVRIALEDLKAEAAQSAARQEGKLAAQQVNSARPSREATVERAVDASPRGSEGAPRPSAEAQRPAGERSDAAAWVPPSERPSPGAKAPAPAVAALDEPAPAVQGAAPAPGQAAGPAAAQSPQNVATSRTAPTASVERSTGSGQRVTLVDARGLATPGRANEARPARPAAPQSIEGPIAERRAAPPSVGPSEELTPAIEGPVPATGQAAPGRADAAQDVGASRTTPPAAGQRSTAPGERVAVADVPAPAASDRAGPGHPAASFAAVRTIEAPTTDRQAAPASFAAPEEAPKADPLVDLPTGPQAARGAAEAIPVPLAHQPASGGTRLARATTPAVRGQATAAAETSVAARPAAAERAQPLESPASERQTAPSSFAPPEETPRVASLVDLPAGPPAARGAGDAVPVPVAHQPGASGTEVARATAPAARDSAAAAPETSVAARPTAAGHAQPLESPASERQAAPASFAAPDEKPGTEAPAVAPDPATAQRPGRGAAEAAPVSASHRPEAGLASERPVERSGSRRIDSAAAASVGTPREQLARSAAGLPQDTGASASERATAPIGEVELVEGPLVAPRRAEGEPETERPGPQTVVARWSLRVRDEGAKELALALAADAGDLAPRAAVAQRPAEGTSSAPGALAARAERGEGRPQQAAIADELPQESIETAPRVGAPVRRTADTAEARVDPTPRSRAPAADAERQAASAAARPLEARATPLTQAPGRGSARLLLPGIERQIRGEGAAVGVQGGEAKDFVLTTVRYGSGEADWDTHKTAMPFLAWQLRENIGFNVNTRSVEVPLESRDVQRSPWIFMTGHKDFRLTAAQVASLRAYLLGGGTLWADDCTHEDDQTWDTAFRREIARVLRPEDGFRLRRITRADNHPLFRSCFDLRNGFAGYFPPPGDKFRLNYIEAIELNGRLIVIYTRNDYGCGLEIQPDTAPLRVSLTGLSPAEMQESSFMMTCNIIVYALTRGRGLEDRGLVGRAGSSLVRHQEEHRTQRDEFANAPATLFDCFAEDHWRVEENWDAAAPARLEYARRADPGAEGRRLAATFQLPPRKIKIVLSRDVPEELDLSGQDRVYVDLECRFEGGARLSLAVATLPDWKYFESRPVFLKPGRNRVYFDLRAATWKTGEPVPEGQAEFCRRIANPDAVRRVTFLLYPIQSEGTVILDRIEFRARPK